MIPEFTLELRKANMKLQSTKIYQLKSIAFYWKINREKLIHIWKIWKKPIIKKTKYKKIMLIHENCNRMKKNISTPARQNFLRSTKTAQRAGMRWPTFWTLSKSTTGYMTWSPQMTSSISSKLSAMRDCTSRMCTGTRYRGIPMSR